MTINNQNQQLEIRRTIRNAQAIWNVPSQSWTNSPHHVYARQFVAVWLSQQKGLISRDVGAAIGRDRTMVSTYLRNHRNEILNNAEYQDRWVEFQEIQNLSI